MPGPGRSPRSRISSAAALRDLTPSFWKAAERRFLTLLSLTNSLRAISAFEKSSTIIARTWRSRGESAGRSTIWRTARGTTLCPSRDRRERGQQGLLQLGGQDGAVQPGGDGPRPERTGHLRQHRHQGPGVLRAPRRQPRASPLC